MRVGPGAGASSAAEVRGARNWASGAVAFGAALRHAQVAVIDDSVGIVLTPNGNLTRALLFTFGGEKIVTAEVIADEAGLEALEIVALT